MCFYKLWICKRVQANFSIILIFTSSYKGKLIINLNRTFQNEKSSSTLSNSFEKSTLTSPCIIPTRITTHPRRFPPRIEKIKTRQSWRETPNSRPARPLNHSYLPAVMNNLCAFASVFWTNCWFVFDYRHYHNGVVTSRPAKGPNGFRLNPAGVAAPFLIRHTKRHNIPLACVGNTQQLFANKIGNNKKPGPFLRFRSRVSRSKFSLRCGRARMS